MLNASNASPALPRGTRVRVACAGGQLATVHDDGPYPGDVQLTVDGERCITIVDRSHLEVVS